MTSVVGIDNTLDLEGSVDDIGDSEFYRSSRGGGWFGWYLTLYFIKREDSPRLCSYVLLLGIAKARQYTRSLHCSFGTCCFQAYPSLKKTLQVLRQRGMLFLECLSRRIRMLHWIWTLSTFMNRESIILNHF